MKRRLVSTGNDSFDMPAELVERTSAPLGMELVSPSRVNSARGSDLVELAKDIAKAEEFVRANVCSKLTLIAEQVRALHRQALDIVNEARRSNELHRAGCNFAKIPGQVYYLYQRPSGQKYFSLLSMNDWKGSPPHEYLGAYRLEADMSWTHESNFNRDASNQRLIDNMLNMSEEDAFMIEQ